MLTVAALETLLDLFRKVSGTKPTHCAIRSDYSLEFDGLRDDGSKYHIEGLPAPGRLEIETQNLAMVVKSGGIEALEVEINYGEQMSKAKTIADRIKEARKQFDIDLDGIAAKVDAFEAKKPEVVARAEGVVSDLNSEADGLDSELRQLSNL